MTPRIVAGCILASLLAWYLLRQPDPHSLPRLEQGPVRIVFFGDSLTAGYGLREAQAYPALVGTSLRAASLSVEIVNQGISGDTAADGLDRIDALLAAEPDLVLLALGVNDGARRRPVPTIRRDLAKIIERIQSTGAGVALAGMELPPGLPPMYRIEFARMYPELAAAEGVPLLPFLLEGIAWRAQWNQPDRVHPTAKGQEKVASHVFAFLEPLVDSMLPGAR